jgi:hypothetical protein
VWVLVSEPALAQASGLDAELESVWAPVSEPELAQAPASVWALASVPDEEREPA